MYLRICLSQKISGGSKTLMTMLTISTIVSIVTSQAKTDIISHGTSPMHFMLYPAVVYEPAFSMNMSTENDQVLDGAMVSRQNHGASSAFKDKYKKRDTCCESKNHKDGCAKMENENSKNSNLDFILNLNKGYQNALNKLVTELHQAFKIGDKLVAMTKLLELQAFLQQLVKGEEYVPKGMIELEQKITDAYNFLQNSANLHYPEEASRHEESKIVFNYSTNVKMKLCSKESFKNIKTYSDVESCNEQNEINKLETSFPKTSKIETGEKNCNKSDLAFEKCCDEDLRIKVKDQNNTEALDRTEHLAAESNDIDEFADDLNSDSDKADIENECCTEKSQVTIDNLEKSSILHDLEASHDFKIPHDLDRAFNLHPTCDPDALCDLDNSHDLESCAEMELPRCLTEDDKIFCDLEKDFYPEMKYLPKNMFNNGKSTQKFGKIVDKNLEYPFPSTALCSFLIKLPVDAKLFLITVKFWSNLILDGYWLDPCVDCNGSGGKNGGAKKKNDSQQCGENGGRLGTGGNNILSGSNQNQPSGEGGDPNDPHRNPESGKIGGCKNSVIKVKGREDKGARKDASERQSENGRPRENPPNSLNLPSTSGLGHRTKTEAHPSTLTLPKIPTLQPGLGVPVAAPTSPIGDLGRMEDVRDIAEIPEDQKLENSKSQIGSFIPQPDLHNNPKQSLVNRLPFPLRSATGETKIRVGPSPIVTVQNLTDPRQNIENRARDGQPQITLDTGQEDAVKNGEILDNRPWDRGGARLSIDPDPRQRPDEISIEQSRVSSTITLVRSQEQIAIPEIPVQSLGNTSHQPEGNEENNSVASVREARPHLGVQGTQSERSISPLRQESELPLRRQEGGVTLVEAHGQAQTAHEERYQIMTSITPYSEPYYEGDFHPQNSRVEESDFVPRRQDSARVFSLRGIRNEIDAVYPGYRENRHFQHNPGESGRRRRRCQGCQGCCGVFIANRCIVCPHCELNFCSLECSNGHTCREPRGRKAF
uniref:uncharacterized protein LOC120334308 n=1 Tax=Styela clava TaxID=7725 RepID=UPI00193A75F6|nr:uncharacterized protein LOC120334308 [Styela clava]